MSSTTHELAVAYRKNMNALSNKYCEMNDLKTLQQRRAFWKFHRRMRNKIYPRGKRNIVLRFEGMI